MADATLRDGVYDNHSTMRRETYSDGKVVAWWSAMLLCSKHPSDTALAREIDRAPWGFYPPPDERH